MNTTSSPCTIVILLTGLLLAGCGSDPVTSALKLIENGNLQKAEEILTQAVQQDPSDANAVMNLAILQYKKGQWDAAMTDFGKAADLAPSDPRPIEFIAAMLAENNQWREAADMLTEAARRDPHSASIQTAQALVDLSLSGPAAARTRLVHVLNMEPAYAPALFNLAVIDRDWLKNPGDARKYFQRYLAVAKNDPHTPIARSALAEKQTQPPSRKSEVTKPEPSAPTPPIRTSTTPSVAQSPMALHSVSKDMTTESAPAPTPVAPNPAEASAAFNQGVRHHQAGESDQAIKEYTRAIRLEPTLVRAQYNLGLLLRAKGDLPRANEAFTHALEGAPNMVDARYMLALVLLDQGNQSGAISQLKTLVEKAPKYADAHLALGMQYKKDKNKLDLARKEFLMYLDLAPNNASARDIRKWLSFQR
ncbi:MAG: tetratricopeptide repeat protein [bacterium]